MTKEALMTAVEATKERFRSVLQTIYDAHNQGQKKQLLKNEEVKALFDLYGVEYN